METKRVYIYIFYFQNINSRKPCLRTTKVWGQNDHELEVYIILDNAPLLTREAPIDHGVSVIRFLLLQLVHATKTRLEKDMLNVSKISLEKKYMLTSYKVSFLTGKCVFWRPELTGK